MERDNAIPTQQYTVFGSRLSFFTMKLVSAMEWYFQGEYEYCVKGGAMAADAGTIAAVIPDNAKLEVRAGTHQMPVMITPENWCVADTTPILTLLDGRMAEPRFYPVGIVGALAAVMEEYFDEWGPRWCIHTRWQCGEANSQHAASTMVSERSLPPAIAEQAVVSITK